MTHLSLTAVEVKPYLVGMGRASQLGPSSLEPPDESLYHCIKQERLENDLKETQGDGIDVPLSISEQQDEPQTPYIPEDSHDDDSWKPTETQNCSLSSVRGLCADLVKVSADTVKCPELRPKGMESVAEGNREGQNYDQKVEEAYEMAYAS